MSTFALVWKDGRRQVTDCGGGRSIIYPHQIDGRMHETTFTISRVEENGDGETFLYLEEKSEDVNARNRELHARRQNEEDQARGFRMPMFDLELKARYPEETDAEFDRRIAIRQGREP